MMINENGIKNIIARPTGRAMAPRVDSLERCLFERLLFECFFLSDCLFKHITLERLF